ncbi:MAG TPA: phosphate ABC transporter ATP-binding protein PstB [Roseiflexaceae bacterium]|nr:phosphate ABC transporter ATP-binding protein PstB [Roseiflexaceae bacterium]
MTSTSTGHSMTIQNLAPFYGKQQAVKPVNMRIEPREITAIIGPSGCGKSTILRCLNRLHETLDGASAQGTVLLDEENIYAPGVDPTLVRRKIGMVFQQPVALRTRSIYENVAVGLRLGGVNNRKLLDTRVEQSLRAAALWDEVKDKLQQSGLALSGGQQQRMSIARTLAVEPNVILMDEPCSALDPISTLKIEELLDELRQRYTVVIVTHNMQQAARIAGKTAVFTVDRDDKNPIGALVEYGTTNEIFTRPRDARTEEYISGRLG